ncbi:hypothetical protein ACVWY3_003230 [Bradyrhizobium sp. USDA 4486]
MPLTYSQSDDAMWRNAGRHAARNACLFDYLSKSTKEKYDEHLARGAMQSPAHSLVPFTVPTSLQPIGPEAVFAAWPRGLWAARSAWTPQFERRRMPKKGREKPA